MELPAQIKKLLLTLFTILLFAASAFAADYYVDADASGNNNGTSKLHAWESFADINWTTVDNGNGKLFVCGTFNETLTVGQSGEYGTPIQIMSCTIANGASADDPGIIDGEATRSYGIHAEEKDYITVDGLTFQDFNTGSTAVFFYSGSVNIESPIIRNVTATNPRGRGIICYRCANGLIENTIADVGSVGGAETDAFYISLGTDNTVDGCTGYQRNGGATGHNDAIQPNEETNFTLKNSYFRSFAGNANSQTAEIESIKTTFIMYNNVFITDAASNGASVQLVSESSSWSASTYIWNNTIYSKGSSSATALTFYENPGNGSLNNNIEEVKNNILITDGDASSYGMWFQGATPSDKTGIIHNLYYAPNQSSSYVGRDNENYYTFSGWQAKGYESSGGVNEDPSLDANYAPDAADDPVVNAGTTITSFSVDKDGTTRPQGDAWDIGAYEYGSLLPVMTGIQIGKK